MCVTLEGRVRLHRSSRRLGLLDEPFTGFAPRIIDRMAEAITEAAAQGAGILVTDHYHHYMLPLVDAAYLMIHKQCKRLDAAADLHGQLAAYGYLAARGPAAP